MDKGSVLEVIELLRSKGEVILHAFDFNHESLNNEELGDYLKEEYLTECLEYPENPPDFSAEAAVWGAKLVFKLAHLILYREQAKEELERPFVIYSKEPSAADMLSADLCLRYVPFLRNQLALISDDDVIITRLDEVMVNWPYSTIDSTSDLEYKNLHTLAKHPCLNLLTIDRIVKHKHKKLALCKEFHTSITSYLSIFTEDLWPELTE